MKLLLLIVLLTAGATAQISRFRAMKKFGNAFDCNAKSDLLTIYSSHPLSVYRMFGCYCLLIRRINNFENGMVRCCKKHDRCYDEVKKLGSCEFPKDHRDSLPYTYSCCGRKLICSDKNNACEAAICNCDHQAANCMFRVLSDSTFQDYPYNSFC